MKEFFSETLPNAVKGVIVIAITIFGVIQVAPPLVPQLNIDTPLGLIYIIPAIGAAVLGLVLNRFVNGVVSLLVLAAISFGLFQFNPEIHALMAQYSKQKTAKPPASASTALAQ